MKFPRLIPSLCGALLAALATAGIATPSLASYVTSEVAPSSVSTVSGTTGAQALSVLATKDLTGTSTDLTRAQRYTPSSSGYQGLFYFRVPSDVDVAAASGITLKANFYGRVKKQQRWTFQVRDVAAKSWVTLGYNDVAAYHTWQTLSFALSGDFSRFVDSSRQVQVRYYTTQSVDTSDLDQLVVAVTKYVQDTPPPPPTPTPEPTPTPTPVPPPSETVQGVRTVFKGSFSNTTDQVNYVANVHDMQIFNGIGQSKINAVKAANPSATIYTYQKVAGIHGPDPIVPAGDPGWSSVQSQDLLWYGPSGKAVTQTQNLWYYIDIINPAKRAAWIPILVANIQSQLALGYTGIFFDNADIIDPSLITEYPASYTDSAYYQAVGEVLKAVQAALPGKKIVINSYMGAAASGNRGPELLAHSDTLFFEGFSMKASTKFFTDRARYMQQINDFAAVVASGKNAVAMDYAPVGDMQRRMWSLASYLIVNSPRSYHYYAGTDAGSELQSYPEDTLDLGVATSDAVDRTDKLVSRNYAGGTVVVNPDTASHTYTMGSGSWQQMVLSGGGAYPATGTITWTAVSGTSMTLAPNTAVIVRPAQ
ncbi:MAG: putative glycoside hydrolase [bacterium]